MFSIAFSQIQSSEPQPHTSCHIQGWFQKLKTRLLKRTGLLELPGKMGGNLSVLPDTSAGLMPLWPKSCFTLNPRECVPHATLPISQVHILVAHLPVGHLHFQSSLPIDFLACPIMTLTWVQTQWPRWSTVWPLGHYRPPSFA